MSPFGPRDDTTPADVLAAGAVLWRRANDGLRVALVHRPRYDDWAYPKGKIDDGEDLPATAVREVAEETGHRCRLGALLGDVRYPVPEGDKLVRYWAAESLGGDFDPNSETDRLEWVDIDRAADQLSYRHDLEVLRRFVDIGPPTATVVLVRHAKAGSRSRWDGDDALRPLSGAGRRQAEALAPFLPLLGPDRLFTAVPLRCRQTLVPVAERLGGAPIDDEPLFGEDHYWDDPAAARERLLALAALGGVTMIASQGGVIPDLVGTLAKSAGIDPDDVPAKKASTWVLTFVDGVVHAADHYPPSNV
ncbi:NUDIX hydrolase [Pseudonocardia humida]|uniref:NUDIX hydrolase n=1 Tax=Pseudonocardia humida TaxID=2800819 RepID=UPI00207C6841|nr:NUDIX hydrolase [Pseudonocardia humida]